jgi:hypothetical protein
MKVGMLLRSEVLTQPLDCRLGSGIEVFDVRVEVAAGQGHEALWFEGVVSEQILGLSRLC